jgi:hypothetical protein
MHTQSTTNVRANVQSPFTSADMKWSFTRHGILMKDYKELNFLCSKHDQGLHAEESS